MKISRRAAGSIVSRLVNRSLVFSVSLVLLFASLPQKLTAYQGEQAPPPPPPAEPAPAYTQQTPEQLQQLVAPIALYPDSLVAQILAASTFPDQIVEADRWLQAHPDLKGDALAQAVNQQPWDPSIRALTAFPSVLGNMDKNLSWASSLGDAYYNQQPDVMAAIQVMRQRAEQAGNLKNSPQENVMNQGPDITIEPTNPDTVYVPEYDPWLVYGSPVEAWPGWYPYPGIWFGGPYVSFGLGFGIGYFGGFGWGWPHWGFDWHDRYPIYDHHRYYSGSNIFFNRNSFYRGGGERGIQRNVERGNSYRGGERFGGAYNRSGAMARPFNGNTRAARGYAEPHGQSNVRSGAFGGYGHGGQVRSFSSRGRESFGGGGFSGGAAHGGGGFHGGGARGGGRR